MAQNQLKRAAAQAALELVKQAQVEVIGVGTGSTVNYFIEELSHIRHQIKGAVASSRISEQRLIDQGIPVCDLNNTDGVPIYVDGADEVDPHGYLLKGGGAALAREKIIAAAAAVFVCIVDESKQVNLLGRFPLAVEVIPFARSYVARELVKLGGDPEYREGCITDNGNVILDVYNLNILDAVAMEARINHIAGSVANGIFARRYADKVLVATKKEGVLDLPPSRPQSADLGDQEA